MNVSWVKYKILFSFIFLILLSSCGGNRIAYKDATDAVHKFEQSVSSHSCKNVIVKIEDTLSGIEFHVYGCPYDYDTHNFFLRESLKIKEKFKESTSVKVIFFAREDFKEETGSSLFKQSINEISFN